LKLAKFIPWLLFIVLNGTAFAEKATIAVATNFLPTLKILVDDFEHQSGHRLVISSAATGTLFNQIQHGAPFDILLAADSLHPEQLAQNGFAIESSRFTYASGQLALAFSPATTLNTESTEDDIRQRFIHAIKNSTGKIAIANPELAPYGIAAQQTLHSLNLWQDIQPQLVKGTNVAQSYQFVITGNAELGFVAQANAVTKNAKTASLRYWSVPSDWHSAIQQQAILLQSAADNQAAIEFLDFLKSSHAKTIIQKNGYGTADTSPMSY
jgi:molybdate transport system substrate-binding protein